jgi:hypothetical protein
MSLSVLRYATSSNVKGIVRMGWISKAEAKSTVAREEL